MTSAFVEVEILRFWCKEDLVQVHDCSGRCTAVELALSLRLSDINQAVLVKAVLKKSSVLTFFNKTEWQSFNAEQNCLKMD